MTELATILVLAAAMRFVFLSGYATDDMTHLAFVRLRWDKASFFDNEPPDSVVPGRFGYPMLAHHIISHLPRRWWKVGGKLLNIAWDLLLVALVWAAARAALPSAPEAVVSPAGLAALAVATSPALMPITARLKSLGARSMGNVLVLGYFVAVWAGMAAQPWVFGAAAALLGLVVLSASQFGVQAVVLGAPFLALVAWSAYPLAVLAAMLGLMGLAVACNRGPCRSLRDNMVYMIEHKRWYRRNAQRGTTAMARNRLADLLDLPRLWRENKDVFFGVFFRRNTLIIALYSFPLFWVVVHASFAGPATGLTGYASDVVYAMACVFLLTSTAWFSFLGQAERYFEYAVPFAAFVLAAQCAGGALSARTALCLIALQIAFTLANLAYVHFASIKAALSGEGADPVVDYLDAHPGRRVLTIPMKLSNHYSYLSRAPHHFYFKLLVHETHGMRHRDGEMPWLELPRTDLDYFHEAYNVDTLVVDTAFLARAKTENGVRYDLGAWGKAYADGRYEVYHLREAGPGGAKA